MLRALTAVALAAAWPGPACDVDANPVPTMLWNTTTNKTLFYVVQPESAKGLPVVLFMHGLTAEFDMYGPFLHRVAAQGFAVVYPFIISPAADKRKFPPVTNTDGTFLLKAKHFVDAATTDEDSPLHGVDAETFAVMGHSMGATCTIMAAAHKLPQAKVAIALHPGICGPFGPPPWPSTWMPSDLETVVKTMPLVMATARNDAAFWPAPHTAEHEEGCFTKTVQPGSTPHGAAFLVFSGAACAEDHQEPEGAKWTDGGHDCVMKPQSPEQPVALTALKLYVQDGGKGPCFEKLWGEGPGSVKAGNATDTVLLRPAATALVV